MGDQVLRYFEFDFSRTSWFSASKETGGSVSGILKALS